MFRYHGRLYYPLSLPPDCTALMGHYAFSLLGLAVRLILPLHPLSSDCPIDSGFRIMIFHFLPRNCETIRELRGSNRHCYRLRRIVATTL